MFGYRVTTAILLSRQDQHFYCAFLHTHICNLAIKKKKREKPVLNKTDDSRQHTFQAHLITKRRICSGSVFRPFFFFFPTPPSPNKDASSECPHKISSPDLLPDRSNKAFENSALLRRSRQRIVCRTLGKMIGDRMAHRS